MEENKNSGGDPEVLIEWTFDEFEKHSRGKGWYAAAIVIFAIFLIYAVWTGNILFGAIVVLAAFIGVIQHYQAPQKVKAAVTEDGIMIGRKFYAFQELENFWLIYNPPAKLLYLEYKNPLKRSLPVPLEEVDPNKVRDSLKQYLFEDLEKEEEELSDRLAKFFKM
ncbi:MAG TPA: hypothetical protein VMX18_02375 [Candidatus Bipolaricaulota bacterium]|nr:hypothetical protein [Candidatus Bipolaricaulota bacterium]